MKDIFTSIYDSNYWRGSESRSGTGSSRGQTTHLAAELENLLPEFDVNSILDIPCGDFHWMKDFPLLRDIEYTGGDIVDKIIKYNTEKYSKDNINFKILDITQDDLPTCDLILIRDCLVHFSFDAIEKVFNNLKNQDYKYALMTSFNERPSNSDLSQIGLWRPLNLLKPPFALPNPLRIINENCTEENGSFRDKSMCLWKKKDLDDSSFDSFSFKYLGLT